MKKIRIDIEPGRRSVRLNMQGIPAFRDGGFDLRYSFDIDTSDRGLLSMGLGLLAPIIARKVAGEVEIVLPQPMADADVRGWRLYHNLPDRIHIRSVPPSVEPAASPAPSNPDSPIGLLYGGGKDSVAALTLAEELYPSHPRDLLRLHWSAQSPERHKEAFESLALPQLRDRTQFEYFSVSSTMHTQLLDRTDAATVHLARYLCSFIPYVEARRPRFVCHGYDALEFHGTAYRRAHPQVLRYIDGIYRSLGVPTTIRSLCFALPPRLNFGVVAKLRPDLVPAIYMCESLDQRWCYKCRKCFTFGILCLAQGINPAGFDQKRMFAADNAYMARIAAELEHEMPASATSKLAELVAYPAHFQAVGGWGEDVMRGARTLKLHVTAISLLDRLFSALRPHCLPHMDALWMQAAAYEGGQAFADGVREIGERHGFELLESSAIAGRVKGNDVRYLMADID